MFVVRLNEVLQAMHRSRHSLTAEGELHDQLGFAASLVPLEDNKLLAFAQQKYVAEQKALEASMHSKTMTNLDMDILDHQLVARIDRDLRSQYDQISEEIVDRLLARCLIDTTVTIEDLLPTILQSL